MVINRWNSSIRYQMILSFTFVTLAVVLISSFALYSYQRDFLYTQSVNSTISLAKTLSFSSSSWVVANDVVGLQEVLQGAATSEDLKFALVLSPRGKVIASTKPEYIGHSFDDSLSLNILSLEPTTHILLNTSNLIDVVVPVQANKRLVGWVRVERTRETLNKNLTDVAIAGIAIAILLILIISMLASFLARRLTSGISRLLNVATDAEQGKDFLRIDTNRKDELGVLAHHLYQAFDTINAEKKERNKLSQAVQQAGESILITNREGVIEYVNPAFTSLTGYDAAQAIGKKAKHLDSSSKDKQLREEIERTILSGHTWQGKAMDRKQSGEFYPSMMTISPIKNDLDETTHFVVFHQDLSQFQALEEQFHQAQKMESLGTLVGGIAHDFNNALAGITGNIYLAKKSVAEMPDVVNKLANVEKLSFRASDMIRQLLTFARKGQIDLNEIPLTPFVKETFKFLRASIPENIKMTQSITNDSMIINGDATQLHQVVMNLINNARDAVEGASNPEIKFILEKFDTDDAFVRIHDDFNTGSYAHLIVKDNGCGIPSANLEHLFEPFYTTKEVNKGTGLGLAMAFGAISSHKGIIEVESEEGKGSSFHVYLPLIESSTKVSAASNGEILEGCGETILIVDDNNTARESNKEILTSLNYKVIEASDGLDAIDTFKRHQNKIMLIVSDLVMPRLGGLDAIRQIENVQPDVKVIFVTGYDKDEVLKGEDYSDKYIILSKPCSVERLSQTIRNQLDS